MEGGGHEATMIKGASQIWCGGVQFFDGWQWLRESSPLELGLGGGCSGGGGSGHGGGRCGRGARCMAIAKG